MLDRGWMQEEKTAHTDSIPSLKSFGDYEIIEEIARGGMGVVYRARQLSLNRVVAVKMILSGALAGDSERRRFRTEAETAARLQHPNIVAIHEVGEHEGHPFFSMDFVEGQSLAEIARHQPLPATRAARYLKTIAEAVQFAHSRGVLHRDLKPSNILIDQNDQPRITDFGLAKQLDDHQQSTLHHQLTITGEVLGSPNFMPPEQAMGCARDVSSVSDVYSLGAVLYQLLTGSAPFAAKTITQTLRLVVETEPVAPRLLNPVAPRDLETICLKCLAKEPRRRYESAQALADDLGRFLEDRPIAARPVGLAEKTWRWCKRNPALAASFAAGLMLLLTIAIGSPIAIWSVQRERLRAEKNADQAQRMTKLESEHRAVAEERELVTRRNLYDVDMRLAQLAFNVDDRQGTMMLLDRNRPQAGQIDLRNWEWRYLWQLCRSDEIATLGFHSNVVSCLAISGDDKLLVTGGYDRKIHVWDLPNRRHLAALPNTETYGLVFSPDNKLFASGGQQIAVLWDARTLKKLHTLPTRWNIGGLAFSPDGKSLATISATGIQLWDVESGTKKMALSAPGTNVERVVYSPDGKSLVLGDLAGTIRVFDLSGNSEQISWIAHKGRISALVLLPDGKSLVSGSSDSTAKLWDVASGQEKMAFSGHSQAINSLAVLPDGTTLVTCSSDQSIRLWDMGTGKEIGRLRGHFGRVKGMALSSDGKIIASGGSDDAVKIWRSLPGKASTGRILTNVQTLAFSPNGRTFATLNAGEVFFGDTSTMEANEKLAESAGTEVLEFSNDGRHFVTGDRNGVLRLWDASTRRELRTIGRHANEIAGLHLSSNGMSLCSWDAKDLLKRWNLSTGEQTASVPVPHRFHALAFSSDQSRLAIGSGAAVALVDITTQGPMSVQRRPAAFHGHRQTVHALAYSPDGRFVASGSADDTVRVWDVNQRRAEVVLGGNRGGEVSSLVFSPDGRRLAVGAEVSGLVKIWDTETWHEVSTFEFTGRKVEAVAYSGDNNTVMVRTGSEGSETDWHILRAPTFQEIEAIERNNAGADSSVISKKLSKPGTMDFRKVVVLPGIAD